MGGEWLVTTLGEVVELKRGYDLPKSKREPGDIPIISSSGLSDTHASAMVKGPGVITGRYGTIGEVFYSAEDFWPLNTTLYVRDFKGNDEKFIYYFLKTINYDQFSDKAAVPGVNRNHLHMAEVFIPQSVETQKSIAHILGTLDDKIELNRQMNATLEVMAQALFKSWFVDFDPVIDNALAAGNPIPEPLQARAEVRAALGDKRKPLPEAIQKQFPSSFVFSEEIGWIPEGWAVVPVSSAIEINPKVSLKKGQIAKYADMKALPTSGYAIEEVTEKEFSGGAKFENGDVLLARITPCLENGKTGIVDFLAQGEPGFGSTEFIVLRPKGKISTAFIAAMARDENFRQHCIANMVGSSGRQRVQNICFDDFYIGSPNNGLIFENYHGTCDPMFKRMTFLKDEIVELAKLRDTLLPKLLSGELRIPDAEKQIEKVTA
nr:restriction endonuclease subunit S [uncultured Desulfuromonas sp.]